MRKKAQSRRVWKSSLLKITQPSLTIQRQRKCKRSLPLLKKKLLKERGRLRRVRMVKL